MLHVWLRAQHSPLAVWHEDIKQWQLIDGWQQLHDIYGSYKLHLIIKKQIIQKRLRAILVTVLFYLVINHHLQAYQNQEQNPHLFFLHRPGKHLQQQCFHQSRHPRPHHHYQGCQGRNPDQNLFFS